MFVPTVSCPGILLIAAVPPVRNMQKGLLRNFLTHGFFYHVPINFSQFLRNQNFSVRKAFIASMQHHKDVSLDSKTVIVIGGGPIGLAAACLLAKLGFEVDVYESRSEIPDNVDESYAIGINPRTLRCLEKIDPELKNRAIKEGHLINSWQIYSGKQLVASLKSGTVYGTTRGSMNKLLYTQACSMQNIRIHFSHKLRNIDFAKRELLFEISGGSKKQKVVSASTSKIIAADGGYSAVRRAMEARPDSGVRSEAVPWNVEFRVIFSKPGTTTQLLDPGSHYIFNGSYCAIVRKDGLPTWACAFAVLDVAPAEERRLLLSRECSDANVTALREYVKRNCWPMSAMIDDDELRRFFGRRSFRGAVVKVNKLNYGEWIILLGDAAHGVIPPTGEGINSGLEDCSILADILSGPVVGSGPFDTYNKLRIPDAHGLLDIALFLNDGLAARGCEYAARIMSLACQDTLKKCGLIKYTYEDYTFGGKALERKPYGDIAKIWKQQRLKILTFTRGVCYPLGYFIWMIYTLLRAPLLLFRAIFHSNVPEDIVPVDKTLKPTVGEL